MEQSLENLLAYTPNKFDLINEIIEVNHDVTKGIFVNRALNMDSIKYIGFDMDYTLAIYNKNEMELKAFSFSIDKLVSYKGYPEFIKELKYDPNYVIRGLVIDKDKGNILKIDRHQSICRAEHGTKRLSGDDKRKMYSKGQISQSEKSIVSIDTLFALPEAYMYAKMVDFMDDGLMKNVQSYRQLFDDIKECIDIAHSDGSLKGEITQNLEKYIYKDIGLPFVLDMFREQGKKLFILTNSDWNFTNKVMHFLLNDTISEYKSWKDYFDIIIVDSKKPDFFVKKTPFFEVNEKTDALIKTVDSFENAKVFSGGNYESFEEFIDAKAQDILYIGDHIYGDIVRSKKNSGWRTVLIVEELEDEIAKMEKVYQDTLSLYKLEKKRNKIFYKFNMYSNKLKQIENLSEKFADSLSENDKEKINNAVKEFKTEIKKIKNRQNHILREIYELRKKIDSVFHKRWGAIFQEFGEISRFGEQVRGYASIYTSRISNFILYPVNHYFKSFRDMLPHDKIQF